MKTLTYSIVLSSVLVLPGCAAVAEYPITTASLAVWGATGKGPTDHALSKVVNKDCATLRVIENEKICQDYTVAEVVDVTIPAVKQSYKDMVAMANDVFAQRRLAGKY